MKPNNSFLINVTAAITSMTLTNPTDGQEITLLFIQDSSGHAVTLASNLLGFEQNFHSSDTVESTLFVNFFFLGLV